jgi:hypothetical protein
MTLQKKSWKAFTAVYFIFPKITGRMMNAPMGYIRFALTLIAAYYLSLVTTKGSAAIPLIRPTISQAFL